MVKNELYSLRNIKNKKRSATSPRPVFSPLEPNHGGEDDTTADVLFDLVTKKELFQPVVEGRVRMYVCNVTTYDLCHIGNARVYVAFDVLYR